MVNNPTNLYDYEGLAKLALPHDHWDFIDAGAMDEITTERNRSAFDQLSIRPRFMRSVEECKIATTMLGQDISMPVFICPTGSHGIAHPDAEVATAKAAARSDTLMMLSTASNCSLEEVAEASTGPLWFQLYHRGKALTEMLVHRAEAAGYKAIVLTIDVPVPSPKERDLRNKFEATLELGNFRDLNLPRNVTRGTDETPGWDVSRVDPITWKDLEWLRSLTSLPLVLKGVRVGEDAKIAAETGCEGVLVSNHGGRQLDQTLSSIETVSEIVEAVNGNCEVYLDSGVRRGSDVLKALALGVKAVGIGRPLYWGLATQGEDGVHNVLELLREEVVRVMEYCGQSDVGNLEKNLINIPNNWGPGMTAP